jgi:hypothetical protein
MLAVTVEKAVTVLVKGHTRLPKRIAWIGLPVCYGAIDAEVSSE